MAAKTNRVDKARRIIESGAVLPQDRGLYLVRGDTDTYRCQLNDDRSGGQCNCAWGVADRAQDDPCSHLLAALWTAQETVQEATEEGKS